MQIDTRAEQLAPRIANLYETDRQSAHARPSEAITAGIDQPGLRPPPQLLRTVMEGCADRPALVQRAVRFVADPETGRTSPELLPRFETISYRELWDRVGVVASALIGDTARSVRPGDPPRRFGGRVPDLPRAEPPRRPRRDGRVHRAARGVSRHPRGTPRSRVDGQSRPALAWCEDSWLAYLYAPMYEQRRWYSPTPELLPATSRASRPIYGRPVSPADLGAMMRSTYEDWVAAGKPCLRQSCRHRHGDHIPSEDMECNECDCLGFVGFAHPGD
jgi:hypothetical protein